ncbi:hypothetical protein DEU56DRAFT_755010 [Suillus clintonianus]|uniref:uncharacterized protein n=1 Tax=Suillus clintonianus TaxID=1904413 RepID=UPI001B87F1B9|nr:uncharacterized protein DEU56DRAFT_755010 [Suillus clintonianus]KAG2141306.1 hypothetical protein DEU56DRAFT_755010 [Suillus clintonianus]
MRHHYGLGVGHLYSHRAGVLESRSSALQPVSSTPADENLESLMEHTHRPHATADDAEEEDEDHVGVEEPTPFEQVHNGSTETLIEALDEIQRSMLIPYILQARTFYGIKSVQLLIDMHPAYLYVPESSDVLRLLQLPHPFTGFSGQSYVVVGYIADYHEVDATLKEAKPWLNVTKNIGTLAILDGMGRIQDTLPLFETNAAGGAFVRAVKTRHCRSNELGVPCPMWFQLPHLLDVSIQFNPPQYPNGFPPPVDYNIHEIPVPMYGIPSAVSLTDRFVTNPLDTILPTALAENMQLTSSQNTDIELASLQSHDMQSASLSFLFDFGNTGWPLASAVSVSGNGDPTVPDDLNQPSNACTGSLVPADTCLNIYPELAWRDSTDLWGNLLENDKRKISRKMPTTAWLQRMKLTKALFLGSLWVGLHGNPFKISAVEMRRLITLSFLTALRIDGKTYAEVLDQPLSDGQQCAPLCAFPCPYPCSLTPNPSEQMLQTFDNGKAELRKVVKASLTHLTDFCDDSPNHRAETIAAFVRHFNQDIHELQKVLAELIGKQAFRELVWAALFVPIDDLTSEHDSGRIADLFVEEVRTASGCLAQDTICNLATLLYQSMLILMVESGGKTAIAGFKTHVNMNSDIMFALTAMYLNPTEFAPFTKTIQELR